MPNPRKLSFEKLDSREMLAVVPDWETTIGGPSYEEARAVVPSRDGGYVAAGWTHIKHGAKRNEDVLVAKVDAQGKEVWTTTFGGTKLDRAYSIAQAGKGYIVAGRTQSFGNIEKGYIARLNANGKVLWTHTYGDRPSTGIRNIKGTKDGGFIATGWTGNVRHDDTNDMFLLKITKAGNVEFFKTFDLQYWQSSHEVLHSPNGGYVLAGLSKSGYGGGEVIDGFIIKTDSQGNIGWTIQNGKANAWDEWHGIARAGGGYVFSGGTQVEGKMRTWLMRTDFKGNILWERTYRKFNYSWHVEATPGGGFAATGGAVPLPEVPIAERAKRQDAFILQVNENGRMIAGRAVGGRYHDVGRYILATAPGKYLIVGYFGLEKGKRPSSEHQPLWDRDMWFAEYSLSNLRI